MLFLYYLGILSYGFLIKVFSLFDNKAKLWIKGREDYFAKTAFKASKLENKSNIWIHAASLGEFEQGRPIIEKIKSKYPSYNIILTFFSPSGYEIRKNYKLADLVLYLPLDTPSNAKQFINLINPKFVIFIKYEFWFFYIKELNKQKIPIFLISSIFRDSHFLFKAIFRNFLGLVRKYNTIFVQNEASAILLKEKHFTNVIIAGDTRFDRVYNISKNEIDLKIIKSFTNNSDCVIIAGSTWVEDEKIISTYCNKSTKIKLIIAPHEIDKKHLSEIEKMFKERVVFYSKTNENDNISDCKVLIIDTIGLLSHIYKYGTIAYIGGGFGKGIHNILEAATFGLPIVFGKNYKKFQEAKDLVSLQSAFSITSQEQFNEIINKLKEDRIFHKNASDNCKNYVEKSIGATDMIINKLSKEKLLFKDFIN